jgi:hypothetical protein
MNVSSVAGMREESAVVLDEPHKTYLVTTRKNADGKQWLKKYLTERGTQCRHYATSRKVAGSIPDGVHQIFY